MAGHAERYALCTVDYKGRGHSNPVIRSFIASFDVAFLYSEGLNRYAVQPLVCFL